MRTTSDVCVPFLKWAGGKRWLMTRHLNAFPTSYDRYIEPFLGSGAVFFGLRPRKALLSDISLELIEAYRAIKQDWEKVYALLRKHHRMHSATFYYHMRSSKPTTMCGRAARFIYLNRTCWNGLYRVNKSGVFNVPQGTKDSALLDTDDFQNTTSLLRRVVLKVSDFESIIKKAKKNDLIFADPPYTVRHNNNGFIKYNEKLFAWEDQVRLSECLLQARKRGVRIVSTNASCPSVRRLYEKDFQVLQLRRASVISGDAENRGFSTELLIRG